MTAGIEQFPVLGSQHNSPDVELIEMVTQETLNLPRILNPDDYNTPAQSPVRCVVLKAVPVVRVPSLPCRSVLAVEQLTEPVLCACTHIGREPEDNYCTVKPVHCVL